MALKAQIQDDLKTAMRAKDDVTKGTLRMLIAAIKNAEIEAGKELDDEATLSVIQKQAKQRRESIVEFEKGNRDDLVQQEQAELVILEAFLPKQAEPEEIEAAARRVIAEVGATGPSDLGKVMPVLVKEFDGRADGRAINAAVRAIFAG